LEGNNRNEKNSSPKKKTRKLQKGNTETGGHKKKILQKQFNVQPASSEYENTRSDSLENTNTTVSLEELAQKINEKVSELEFQRGYRKDQLLEFVIRFPEISIEEFDELLQVNRNVKADEIDKILNRFKSLNWEIVKNYLIYFPEKSSQRYYEELSMNPELAYKYPAPLELNPKESYTDKIVSTFTRDEFSENITDLNKDILVFTKWWNILKEKHPQHFENLAKKHPDIESKIQKVINTLEITSIFLNRISDSEFNERIPEIISTIEKYNEEIKQINEALAYLNELYQENKNIEDSELEFLEHEKEELKRFAKALYQEFFPPSYLDQAVLFYTGQKELEGYQKILLSAGNGVEMAIKGAINIFNPETYSDAYDGVETILSMDIDDAKRLLESLPTLIRELDSTDSISASITLIYAVIIFRGGLTKISEFAKKMNYSEKILKTINAVAYSQAGIKMAKGLKKVVPLAILASTSLPYIKYSK
jgi:hypothetical protein